MHWRPRIARVARMLVLVEVASWSVRIRNLQWHRLARSLRLDPHFVEALLEVRWHRTEGRKCTTLAACQYHTTKRYNKHRLHEVHAPIPYCIRLVNTQPVGALCDRQGDYRCLGMCLSIDVVVAVQIR